MKKMGIGQIVTAFNKTGKYIGEITAIRIDGYTVRILAVLTHPLQGDLHHPKQVDVPFFHERKALAFREQANIPLKMARPYDGAIPDYKASLRNAVNKLYADLASQSDDPFSIQSLEALKGVMKEYELMYAIDW